MKKKSFIQSIKKAGSFFLLGQFVFLSEINAQNQLKSWCLPPKTYNFLTQTSASLPVNTPYGYSGTNANNTYNMMTDGSNNINFFIVDGSIYDKSGNWINNLQDISSDVISGNSECTIIPVPNYCNQYYIVSTDFNVAYTFGYGENAFYSKLDMNTETLSSPTALNVNPYSPNYLTGHIAVSPLRSDNTRFLYISNAVGIVKFIVSSSGIVLDPSGNSILFTSPYAKAASMLESEMELYSVSPNGPYTIALPYVGSSPSNNYQMFVGNLDVNGNLSTSHTYQLAPYNGTNAQVPHGLEFSPNGNYLYYTQSGTTNNINYINLSSNVINILNPSLASDFGITQIETGYDITNTGNYSLYFAGPGRIARLDAPNSPSVTNWHDNAIMVDVPVAHVGLVDQNGQSQSLRELPDQIDQENYSNMYPTVTVTPNPTTICAGTCTTLSYTSTNNDPVQVTYKYGKLLHGPYTYTAGNFGSWCPAATQTYSVVPVIPAGSGYCPSTTLITINVDNVVLNPGFTIQSNTTSATVFTVSATATTSNAYINSVGGGYWWQVCHVDNNGNCLDQIATNPSTWWNSSNPTINSFPTYNGTSPFGTFYRGETYQISRGVWKNCQTWSGISSTISWCIGCREAKT
ncbi:MAG TPA: hypothetical protein VNX01_15375, partial [Bacteroidia bacterium]|nr:hypothetical protein [Bacteroidia bacterium]